MKPSSRIPAITEVVPSGSYNLTLRFDDGRQGDVDIAAMVRFEGVFAPLKDPVYFARVRVDAELGTIVWPNGADLDPLVLYATATGKAIDI